MIIYVTMPFSASHCEMTTDYQGSCRTTYYVTQVPVWTPDWLSSSSVFFDASADAAVDGADVDRRSPWI